MGPWFLNDPFSPGCASFSPGRFIRAPHDLASRRDRVENEATQNETESTGRYENEKPTQPLHGPRAGPAASRVEGFDSRSPGRHAVPDRAAATGGGTPAHDWPGHSRLGRTDTGRFPGTPGGVARHVRSGAVRGGGAAGDRSGAIPHPAADVGRGRAGYAVRGRLARGGIQPTGHRPLSHGRADDSRAADRRRLALGAGRDATGHRRRPADGRLDGGTAGSSDARD